MESPCILQGLFFVWLNPFGRVQSDPVISAPWSNCSLAANIEHIFGFVE